MIPLLRNPVILLVVVIGGGLLAIAGGAVTLSAGTNQAVAPESEFTVGGWVGHVHLSGGQNDGSSFITSGEPGYKSQTIVAAGKLRLASNLWGGNFCS